MSTHAKIVLAVHTSTCNHYEGEEVAETNVNEVNALLVQGFKAAKEGRREEAYSVFCEVVNLDPNNEHGWLYRAATTDDLSEAYVCLQRVLSLNPNNTKALRGIERIKARMNEEAQGAEGAGAAVAVAEQPENATPPPNSRVGDSEVVSGFGMAGAGTADAGRPTVPSDSGNGQVPMSAAQVRARSGPTIPPFGTPPPLREEQDEDNNVSDVFDNVNTQPRYSAPPPIPPTVPPMRYVVNDQPAEAADFSGRVPAAEDASIPAMSAEEPDYSALRETGKKGRRKEKPQLQQFGGGTTALDEMGVQRRQRNRRLLGLIFLALLLVAIILGAYLIIRAMNNNNNATQTASTTTAASDTSGAGTAGVTLTTGAATTSGVVATTDSGSATAESTTATASTTAAPATTTAEQTTAAVSTTAAPATTTAAPATTAAPTPVQVVTTAVPTGSAAPVRPVFHSVRSSDNLTNLARTYNTSIDAIVAANRDYQALGSRTPLIGPNLTIYNNTRLVIPVQRPDFRGRATVVKDGETLDAIAGRYKVNPADILSLNGLAAPTDIKPGDPLLIP